VEEVQGEKEEQLIKYILDNWKYKDFAEFYNGEKYLCTFFFRGYSLNGHNCL